MIQSLFFRFFIVLFLCASPIVSQTRFGAGLHLDINNYSANFTALPGFTKINVPFLKGNGINQSFDLILDIPISQNFRLGFRPTYQNLSGSLTADENTVFAINGGTSGIIRHTLDANISSFGLQVTGSVRFWQNLAVAGGIQGALLTSKKFDQGQEIIQPDGIDFVNPPPRNFGNIPNFAPLQFYAILGLEYSIPVNAQFIIQPEIFYQRGLTSVVNGLNWTISPLKLGVSLLFSPAPPKPIISDTIFKRDTTLRLIAGINSNTLSLISQAEEQREEEINGIVHRTFVLSQKFLVEIPKPKSLLVPNIAVKFILPDGKEAETVKIPVEESLLKRIYPLYLVLQLEKNFPSFVNIFSHEKFFSIDSLSPENIQIQITDILGKRLSEQKNAILKMKFVYSSPEKFDLVQEWAKKAEKYFTEIWNLTKNRFEITFDSVGNEFSPKDNFTHVEFSSNDAELFAPIVRTDTIRTGKPPDVRLSPSVITEAGVQSWNLEIYQSGKIIKQFRGNDTPPANLSWNLSAEPNSLKLTELPMEYIFSVTDRDGQTAATQKGTITFEQSKSKPISAESANEEWTIWMPFDEKIPEFQKKIFKNIASRVSPKAKVTITGRQYMVPVLSQNLDIPKRQINQQFNRPRMADFGNSEEFDNYLAKILIER